MKSIEIYVQILVGMGKGSSNLERSVVHLGGTDKEHIRKPYVEFRVTAPFERSYGVPTHIF